MRRLSPCGSKTHPAFLRVLLPCGSVSARRGFATPRSLDALGILVRAIGGGDDVAVVKRQKESE
jgi:hypothetical protein